jgi:hypothetical protein
MSESEPVSPNLVVITGDPSFNTVTATVEIANDLIQLLQANMKLPSYNLTQKQQDWIELLIKNSPESFAKINSDVQELVASGSLGVQSIPKLIQLCADIFNNASCQNGIASSVNIYILIKFVLDVLLDSSLLPIPFAEKTIIQALVDSSLGLLVTSLADSPSVPVVSMNKCCK